MALGRSGGIIGGSASAVEPAIEDAAQWDYRTRLADCERAGM